MSVINLTQYELEVIQGCLLGDGCLSIKGKSSCFMYGSSNLDHVEYVWNQLKDLVSPRYKDGPIRREIYDKRTKKTYINYSIRTKSSITFYNLRMVWYPEGLKIVPKDLELTNTIILLWYVGDGSLDKSHGYIKLCTDSFDKDSLEFLNGQLQEWKSWINFTNNRIYIKRIFAKHFLNYIGDCPVESYKHKWEIKQLKNSKIDEDGPIDHSLKYLDIVKDFKTEEYTIYRLYKKYGVPIKCIKNYFKNNNINFTPVNNRIRVEQKDLNDNHIKTWDSIKSTGFDPSAIVACCKGKRQTHKGYKWNYEK
jgi:hypothetical protein